MPIAKGFHFPDTWRTEGCRACGTVMTFRRCKPRLYCSQDCANASGAKRRVRSPMNWAETTCPTCGLPFEYLKSWPRKFCSNACAGKANVGNTGRPTNNRYEMACEVCAARFWTTPAVHARFCSQPCFGRWLSENVRGDAHPNTGRKFNKPTKGVTLSCPICRRVFPIKPSEAGRRRYCSKVCQGAALAAAWSGKNNPGWTGGYQPYYGPSWRAAMRAVRARDKACLRCGKSPSDLGRALDVHHLAPFKSFGVEQHAAANNPANLIALCNQCHLAIEWETNRRAGHA